MSRGATLALIVIFTALSDSLKVKSLFPQVWKMRTTHMCSTLQTESVSVSIDQRFLRRELPIESYRNIEEDAAQSMIRTLSQTLVTLPSSICDEPMLSSFSYFARTKDQIQSDRKSSSVFGLNFGKREKNQKPPFLLLHGFDSSCLEFRRLAPLLCKDRDVYAMDILGWGFNQHGGINDFSPNAKMEHLRCFLQQVVGGKCVIVGASTYLSKYFQFTIQIPWSQGNPPYDFMQLLFMKAWGVL